MKLMLPLFQKMEETKTYKIGYEVGYFIGSNFWEVVAVAIVILAVILYFAFFRKRRGRNKI